MMKRLIAVAVLAVAAAGVPEARADSATLAWNQVALEAVERAKPNQHQTARLLAYVSFAQYAAISQAGSEPARRDAVATATAQVIAGLLPAQAAYVEQRARELKAGDSDVGRRTAERVLAEAGR